MNNSRQLSNTPFSTIFVCLMISILLATPTGLWLLLQNLKTLAHPTASITLYLKKDTTEKQILPLLATLKLQYQIIQTKIISPEQEISELPEVDKTTLSLRNLPWVIIALSPTHSLTHLETLIQSLNHIPQIEKAEFDKSRITRLHIFIHYWQHIILLLAIFFSISSLFIIIYIMRSVPCYSFLTTGLIYGLLSGIFAWQWLDLLLIILKKNFLSIAGFDIYSTLILLSCSILLCAIGAVAGNH